VIPCWVKCVLEIRLESVSVEVKATIGDHQIYVDTHTKLFLKQFIYYYMIIKVCTEIQQLHRTIQQLKTEINTILFYSI